MNQRMGYSGIQGEKRDPKFVLLYAIGALLVISGHFGSTALNFGGTFRYDTFHMPLFMFASGYFYKSYNHESAQMCGNYILKKVRTLLVPYFCWNLIYGLLDMLIHHIQPEVTIGYGYSKIGQSYAFNLRSLFLTPFMQAGGFEYNGPAWFVCALFLVSVSNVLLCYVLKKLKFTGRGVYLAVCLCLAACAVRLSNIVPHDSTVWEYIIMPVRVGYLLFWFAFGQIYRKRLEYYDKRIRPEVAILISIVLNSLLILLFGDEISAVYSCKFAPSGFLYTIARAFLGIWFWLRVCDIISPVLGDSRLFNYIGTHTFSLMMHQGLAGMCVNYILSKIPVTAENFDSSKFYSTIWYSVLPAKCRFLQVILIVALILSMVWIYEQVVKRICKNDSLTKKL